MGMCVFRGGFAGLNSLLSACPLTALTAKSARFTAKSLHLAPEAVMRPVACLFTSLAWDGLLICCVLFPPPPPPHLPTVIFSFFFPFFHCLSSLLLLLLFPYLDSTLSFCPPPSLVSFPLSLHLLPPMAPILYLLFQISLFLHLFPTVSFFCPTSSFLSCLPPLLPSVSIVLLPHPPPPTVTLPAPLPRLLSPPLLPPLVPTYLLLSKSFFYYYFFPFSPTSLHPPSSKITLCIFVYFSGVYVCV